MRQPHVAMNYPYTRYFHLEETLLIIHTRDLISYTDKSSYGKMSCYKVAAINRIFYQVCNLRDSRSKF